MLGAMDEATVYTVDIRTPGGTEYSVTTRSAWNARLSYLTASGEAEVLANGEAIEFEALDALATEDLRERNAKA
ncbi:MAG: hypothetical protein HY054_09575 [Proteobacteria bacterium]|nr:hypothetical protein [Pseudomonadota bacterium]